MPKHMKLKRWLFWAIGVVFVSVFIYLAWCYGLWGRGSLFLQYTFQCGCPLRSEPFRYPEQVEVLIPACQRKGSSTRISSGGSLVMVEFKYVLDLRREKHIPVTSWIQILSEDLLFDYDLVWDIHAGNRYPVEYPGIPTTRDEWGREIHDLNALASILRNADEVFLTEKPSGPIMFRKGVQYSLVSPTSHNPPGMSDMEILDAYGIPYVVSSWDIMDGRVRAMDGIPSPSGKFVAKRNGIYLASMNERIVEMYQLHNTDYMIPITWHYNEQGIIIDGYTPYVLDFWEYVPTFVPSRFFPVPQPVLLLKIPSEYLSSASMP